MSFNPVREVKLRENRSGYYPALKTGLQETTTRVQEMHQAIAGLSFQMLGWIPGLAGPVRLAQNTHDAIAGGVYAAIRQGVGGALTVADLLEPHAAAIIKTSAPTEPPSRLAVGLRSALNAVVGDHLHHSANPLAIKMGFYADGHRIPLTSAGLSAHLPQLSDRLCLFVHGLGCDEHSWQGNAGTAADAPNQHYGRRLQVELGYTPLYLRYNTGLPVADNGQALAQQLQNLLGIYPQPVRELVIIGHSMGGLVARSAGQHAADQGLPWLRLTRMIICLGSPHRGAPLEKLGHQIAQTLHRSPVTAPLGKIAAARSAGIRDLRYGLHRIARPGHHPPALPGVALRFIGANLVKDPDHPLGHLLGDGLVTLHSATTPKLPGDVVTARLGGLHHMALLNEPRVYQQIRQWLAANPLPE